MPCDTAATMSLATTMAGLRTLQILPSGSASFDARCAEKGAMRLIFYIAAVLAATPAFGAVVIEDDVTRVSIGRHLSLLVDPTLALGIDDVARGEVATKFELSKSLTPNFGYTRDAVWARLEIDDRRTLRSPLVLFLEAPMVDRMEVFLPSPTGFVKVEEGDALPFAQRPFPHRFPNFNLTAEEPRVATYYVRVTGESALLLDMSLATPQAFYAYASMETFVLASYLGVMAAMALYNLFLFASTRDGSYLAYVFFIASFSMTQFTMSGLSYQLLWPGGGSIANRAVSCSIGIALACATAFSRRYLDLRDVRPRLFHVGTVLIVAAGATAVVAVFFPYRLAISLIVPITIAVSVYCIGIGIIRLRDGSRPAGFFVFAWAILCVATVTAALRVTGHIPVNLLTQYAQQLGSSMEVILLSLGLADRIKTLQMTIAGNQKEKFLAERAAKEGLQEEVQRQTFELTNQKTALEDANVRLREVDRQKTTFFQNISHELRTPLTLIMGPIDESRVRHPEDQGLEIASRNSRRLYRLVNQLLDLQKVASKGQIERSVPIRAFALLSTWVETFAAICATKGVSLLLVCPAELHEACLLADPDALEKIVFNYLSNAWKHSPPGGTIRVEISESGGLVRIAVADQGAGIAAEDRRQLFMPFIQLDSSATREHEGTGLGLALVRQLTDAMGGTCGVDSELGHGAVFWADFPVFEARAIVDVLVVDDDQDFLDLFRGALNRLGLVSVFAGDALEARAVLKHHVVKVILSDAVMPGENGVSLLNFVAESQPDCFRALMTASSDRALLERAANDKAINATVLKPFSLDRVCETIVDAVKRSVVTDHEVVAVTTSREWLLADIVPMKHDESQTRALSPPTRTQRILVVDDLEDMREFVAGCLRRSGFHVDTASGAEAAAGLIAESIPSVVIVDWMMPKVTGPEFIATLRGRVTTAGLPVILLTAKSDEESRAIGTKSGANAYLSKPFNEAELVSTVENLISLKAKEAEVVALNKQISETVLSRFLPPRIVSDIMEGHIDFGFNVKTECVTVMFADLCGFTKATEDLGPYVVAKILNEYLVEMTEVIFTHDGVVDKFIGDGIMALFGVPTKTSSSVQVDKAVACARSMQVKLSELNAKWAEQRAPRLEFRIGIHQGPVIMGHFGGARRSDFTAIGSTVNMAARIEKVAGRGEVFVSRVVRDFMATGQWESAGKFVLKGLDGEHALYRLTPIAQLEQKVA